jgi:AbrB family looped-hinge helix DNA binding protein
MERQMGIYDAKISDKGQVTVPMEVRKKLGIDGAQKLMFRDLPQGGVEIIAKKQGLKSLKGLFGKPVQPIDDDKEIMATVWERNRTDRKGPRP